MTLNIDNHIIDTPIVKILDKIHRDLKGRKLRYYKEKGSDIRVTCPNKDHKGGQEDTPDCGIYIGDDKEKYGHFNCFACGAKGPFEHFVALCFERSDEWAKQWLIDNFADFIPESRITLPKIELNKKLEKKFLDESILKTFQSWHPYLAKRKLTKEVCEKFEVMYDEKSKCIVFAVRDEKGKLWMLTRRSVEDKKFIIDADKEKPVYLLYYLIKNNIKEAYIVESQVNALTLWTHGLPGIALFGTGTKEQYDILNKSGIRTFHLCFDGDEAGDKAINNFKKNIRKDSFIDVIRLPRGKDINDLSYEEVEKLICSRR